MTRRRTYWHLESLQRKPTEYEIATSKLLYYRTHGFEVENPRTDWYERYQKGSPLQSSDWERFSDPRQTTYAKYTEIQADKEVFVTGLLAGADERGTDADLPGTWLDVLSGILGPLRYPVHGLQMAAAYVGQMAPSGRITVAALFQTADEVRRIQHLAMRLHRLRAIRPDFGRQSKETWQNAPAWQPWREVIEKLLVTYDWGEAFVALNLVVKPMFDELFMSHLRRLARREGDDLLAELLRSLDQDCQWHREWSVALVQELRREEANMVAVRAWLERWRPLASRAVAAFAFPLGLPSAAQEIENFCTDYWGAAGLMMDAR